MSLDLMLKPFDERVAEVRRQAEMDERRREIFDRAAAAIDREKVAGLQAFVAENAERLSRQPAFKYLDIPLYLAEKSRHVVELDLDRTGPCKILDLGSGAGHFMFLARCHGHQALGVDVSNEIYDRMCELYGLDRLNQRIVSGTALGLQGGFDLVTAMQMTFNRPVGPARLGRASTFWTLEEWRWFFDEIGAAMKYPGRVFFHLNPQPHPETGQLERENVVALFLKNGAVVDRPLSTALFELERPLSFRG